MEYIANLDPAEYPRIFSVFFLFVTLLERAPVRAPVHFGREDLSPISPDSRFLRSSRASNSSQLSKEHIASSSPNSLAASNTQTGSSDNESLDVLQIFDSDNMSSAISHMCDGMETSSDSTSKSDIHNIGTKRKRSLRNDHNCVDVQTPNSKETPNKSNVQPATKRRRSRRGNECVDMQTPNSNELNIRVYPEWHKDQWIKGYGKTGYKGVGRDPKTIKSKPWRCKYKTRQFRFALMGDAIEHFYRLTKHDQNNQ